MSSVAARCIVDKDIYLSCTNRDPNRECQLLDFRLRRLVDYYRIYLSMEQSEVTNIFRLKLKTIYIVIIFLRRLKSA